MSRRERLPQRRGAESFPVIVDGMVYQATVGRFPDGRPGEIFLNASKANSAADVAVRDAAIAASLGLQYGLPLDVLRKALTKNVSGKPSGALGIALQLIGDQNEDED